MVGHYERLGHQAVANGPRGSLAHSRHGRYHSMNSYIDDPDKGAHDSAQWERKWTTDKYIAKRRANFETVDAYLSQPIGRLLDIGCGFAWESRWFEQKYGTELWLLDGDQKKNANKPETASYGNWNTTSDSLYFYHSFEFLDAKLKELGTKNYHLIDTHNISKFFIIRINDFAYIQSKIDEITRKCYNNIEDLDFNKICDLINSEICAHNDCYF